MLEPPIITRPILLDAPRCIDYSVESRRGESSSLSSPFIFRPLPLCLSFLFFFFLHPVTSDLPSLQDGSRRYVERASAIAAIHQPRAIFAIIMEGWAGSAAFSPSYCSFLLLLPLPEGGAKPFGYECHSRRGFFHLLVKGTVQARIFFNCGKNEREEMMRDDFFLGKLEEISRQSLKSVRKIRTAIHRN